VQAFVMLRTNIERIVDRGKDYRFEAEEDVVGFAKRSPAPFVLKP
jgi:hypothetical protein